LISFSQPLHGYGIFHSWKESRRKSITGWILLSMGVIMIALSFSIIRYTFYFLMGSAIAFLIGVLFVIKGKLDWTRVIKEFTPIDDYSLIDTFNRKIQSLPYVAVYESENPTRAAAILTLNHSYILPLTTDDSTSAIVRTFADQMNRILPLPWQQPVILEPVGDAMELEAAIHRITEESPSNAITEQMLETVYQFAKVIQSFVIIGRPLPQLSGKVIIKQQPPAVTQPQQGVSTKKHRSFSFNIRWSWLIWLCVLIGIGYGIYYLAQNGATPETTYLEQLKITIAEKLPIEYHRYIGLGKLQDNIEQSVKAVTAHSISVYDRVGGGRVLSRMASGAEVNVIQEELVNDTYWYYIQSDDNDMGWVKNSDLIFKHILPAKSVYYHSPVSKEPQISPERAIPFAVKQKYLINNKEWLGIRGFKPINDIVWIQRGDYQ
jgi:hypothetical protein